MAGSADSYFQPDNGGQIFPTTTFFFDHGLLDLLPTLPIPNLTYVFVDAEGNVEDKAVDSWYPPPPVIPSGANNAEIARLNNNWAREREQADGYLFVHTIRASATVDSFASRFIGQKTKGEFDADSPQLLQWPRSDENGNPLIVRGHTIPIDRVPTLICLGTAHVAILLMHDKNPFGPLYEVPSVGVAAPGTYLKRAQMGPMAVEYDVLAGADSTEAGALGNIEFTIDSLLRPLFVGGGGDFGVIDLDLQR